MKELVAVTRLIFLLCILYSMPLAAAPNSVDTSTVSTATSSNHQRKTFFDTVNEYHWSFYYNGTAIEYSYSDDGEQWVSAGSLAYDTNSFAVTFKVVSGVAYAFLVSEANNFDVVIRRATLGDAEINFEAAETVFDGDSLNNRFIKPTVAISENGKLWVAAIKDFGGAVAERFQVVTRRSTNDADEDISQYTAQMAVGPGTPTLNSAIIMPQTGDSMSLISSTDGTNIVGYKFDGALWSSANSGGDYSWFGFPTSGIVNNLGSVEILAIAVDGNDVYVGGGFTAIGGNTNMSRIARWDGSSWHALKSGLSSDVNAILVHDGDVYVGGGFTNAGGNGAADYVARWDGTDWQPLKNGVPATVYALAASGNDLYVGGNFQNADGIAAADRIARWDIENETWHSLGGDGVTVVINNAVRAIGIIGTDVYVGGQFTNADGIAAADYIARWDGAAWNALGTGTNSNVWAIAIADNDDLYIGGDFGSASGVASTGGVARWNGTNWSALGSGTGQVRTLAFVGANLYAGGLFNNGGGNANADKIGFWNGVSWNALGTGLSNTVFAIADCGGSACVGGIFTAPGNIANGDRLARWDGTNWNSFSSGGFNHGTILAITAYQGDVYVGGTFYDVGGIADADHIARWDGTKWNAVTTLSPAWGGGIAVEALLVSGGNLYIGGAFADMGGVAAADHMARWDGNSISALGTGFNYASGRVRALAADSDGKIYAAGDFPAAGGVANTSRIAFWDGAAWNPLNTGLNASVYALAASGTDIYVGGLFTDASGIAEADRIARWDGANWSALGTGVANGQVNNIKIMDDDIYIGGSFTDVAAIATADRIARWDGVAWSAVGSGIPNGTVNSLAVSGTNLYAGGSFTDAGGNTDADRVAYWDGTSWHGIGYTSGTVNSVSMIGDSLYVGATYALAEGVENWRTLLVYAPAVANDANLETEISAVSSPAGDIFLTYTNDLGHLNFKAFDAIEEEWQETVTINNQSSTNPNISYHSSSGDILASWIDSDGITYVGAQSPYQAGDWGIQEILYNLGTNLGLSAPELQATDDLLVLWTNGVADPYQVYADFSAYGPPTVAISTAESDPTNSSVFTVEIEFEEDVTGFIISDITLGNATASNFIAVDANSYTVDVTPDEDGVVTVDIAAGVAEDAVGHGNFAANQFSITYDSTSPTLEISSGQSSPTNSSPFSVTFEFDEDVTGFTVGDIVVGNGSAGNFAAIDGNTYTADITPNAHGNVTVDVAGLVAQDAAGNGNDAAAQFVMNYDIVDPTITLSSDSTDPTNDSPFTVEIEFSENVSGFVIGDIAVTNGITSNFTVIDDDSYTVDVTPTTDGLITVNIAADVANDAAGNGNTAAAEFDLTYDNTPPVVTITDPVDPAVAQANVAAFALEGTCTENGRVVAISAISNGGGATITDTPNCNAGAWQSTLDLSGAADGEVTFSADQEDQVGLDAITATRQRTKDTVSPVATISSSELTPSKNTPFNISIEFSEDIASFDLADLAVTNGSASNLIIVDSNSVTAQITPSSQGEVLVNISANTFQDLVGNENIASGQFELTHDSISPSIVISSTEANPTEASSIPITIEFSEDVTGFAANDLIVTNGELSGFSSLTPQLYSANISPTSSGAVRVDVAAGVAEDAARNPNNAAPQFSITYEDPAGQTRTICSVWNGFFSGENKLVWNILEHLNTGSRAFAVETILYDIDGVAQSSTKFSLEPKQQLDLLVHDLPGWTADSYGLVCSTIANEEAVELDGRMVTYKRRATGGFEYVFASPFNEGSSGNQYVSFNTYQPSLDPKDSENFVANWIQVTNFETSSQNGVLNFYNQEGEIIKRTEISLKPRGQSDISAHDWSDPTVGYVEWKPYNQEAKFTLSNTRYLYDNSDRINRFDGVLYVRASKGSNQALHGILDTANSSAIVELVNVTDEDSAVILRIYDADGSELENRAFMLPAHKSIHIITDEILSGDTGSISLAAPDGRIIASALQYGRNPNGSVSYIYGIGSLSPVGDRSYSSYNTYQNQDCDIYLTNLSNSEQRVSISMSRNNGAQILNNNLIELAPKQTLISNICSVEPGESYGILTLDTENPGHVSAYLIRKDRSTLRRYPIAVR